ncbi:AEC family transporter [Butyricicoccus sp.]|uniref:AEC family transporter n=1 Tax=Butyricicoccus sp. TaxID=2049021 RepID=UPI003D7CD1AA
MDSFIFSLNATMPVFLVIVLGYILKQLGLFTDEFCRVGNKYVFLVALPVLLFRDIAQTNLYTDFKLSFVLYCAGVTTVVFLGVWFLAAHILKDKSLVGAFAQASVRSSAAILGIAFVENMYGNAGLAPLMIVSAVPLFNIYSVIILTFSADGGQHGTEAIRKACINVLKNPIIIGIVLGLPFSLLRIDIPTIPLKMIESVGATATPLALLVVGAGFEGTKALAKIKPTLWATAIKLVILPAVFLPLAIALGFHDAELVAALIMLGSPTTVSCYVMATNMRNDGELSTSIIVLTTLLSSITLTGWIFLLRSMGLM